MTEFGIEIDEAARATRDAAGFKTVANDVTTTDPGEYAGIDGLIASPPCQDWSKANSKGLGIDGERGALVHQVMRYASAIRPRWVACEQVPTVLPFWQQVALALQELGYSTWAGKVNAEQFGVPQTRTRAILIASLDREVVAPVPSHSRYHSRTPGRLDEGVLPWISMAEALSWGLTERPSYTVVATSDGGGGPRPLDGGSGTRRMIRQAMDDGKWLERINDQSQNGQDFSWPWSRPATTLATRDLVANPGANANRFNGSTKSRNDGIKVTVQEAGLLQSFAADFPWQGSRTKQFQQVGNAIPPLMAEAVLRAVL